MPDEPRIGAERRERPGPRHGRRSTPGKRRPRCAGVTSLISATFDLVALDQRVREQPLAHALDLGARLVGGGRRRRRGRSRARARASPTGNPSWRGEALDRLSLGVENPCLRPERGRSPSSKDDLGVGEVVVEREPGEALVGLDVLARVSRRRPREAAGAGAFLSQPATRASRGRTACRTRLRPPGFTRPRARSGTSPGQHLVDRGRARRTRRPNSNFVSAMMMPRSRGVLGRAPVERGDPLHLGRDAGADELGRPSRVDVLVVPGLAFVAGVKIGAGSRSDSRRPAGSSMPEIAPVPR